MLSNKFKGYIILNEYKHPNQLYNKIQQLPKQQQMLKQKLSDIFRRDKKQKTEQSARKQNTPVYFDQSFFDCKLVYNPHKLSLIKVIANITAGADAGMPMMVNCKWLIKKTNQYSEIQGVTSSCYQPCIEDVGCSILVQITPLIEGKIYSGALITKQTGPLQLGSSLETQFTQVKNKLYYQKQSIEFPMKIQAIFGKQTEYTNLQYPQDGQFVIKRHEDNNFQIQIVTSEFKAYFWITKQFPTSQFIRKSYNSVVISFTEFQSMRLAFKEGTDRQILGLLLRTLTANSTLDWPIKQQQNQQTKQEQANRNQQNMASGQIQQQNEKIQKQKLGSQNNIQLSHKSSEKLDSQLIRSQQFERQSPLKWQKSVGSQENLSFQSTPKKQNSELHEVHSTEQSCQKTAVEYELKIGQLNIQLNKTKKQFKQIMRNYNMEKQNKCKLEHQIKKINDKMTQFDKIKKERDQLLVVNDKIKQDNRFYKNQVALLNKNIKKKESELQAVLIQKQILEKNIKKIEIGHAQVKNNSGKPTEDDMSNESQNWKKLNNQLSQQNDELKMQIQKLENSLRTANKKIQSLQHQKVIKSEPIIPMKSQYSAPQSANLNRQLGQKQKKIADLQFKLSNLQMLLKHKGGERGNQALTFHKIINSLTQDIREKQEQLQSVKKVNKQLLQKLKISNINGTK